MSDLFNGAEFVERLVLAFNGFCIPKIAEKLGIEKQAIYRWRDEKNQPDLERILYISQVTRTSLHWLLTGDGPVDMDSVRNAGKAKGNTVRQHLIDALTLLESQSTAEQ